MIAAGVGDDSRPQREQMTVGVGADRELTVIAWRLTWCCVDCSRVSTVFTGRPSSFAAIAVCPWIDSSSFAPNAPPLASSEISTSFGSSFRIFAICWWS